MLSGKNIFITGTNRGLGKAILVECAKNGANIWAHARTKSDEFLEFIQEQSEKNGVQIYPVFFDMTNSEEMILEIQRLLKKKIKFNVLINNAGIAHGGLFQMTTINKIKDVFEINFFAHLQLTQLLLKAMVRNSDGNIAYGASKAAMIAWTKVLSKEVVRYNIRVNAIAPGLSDTDMSNLMEKKSGAEMIQQSLMKRLATPEEIANVAVFLASEKASFVNGQIIRVDGGSV